MTRPPRRIATVREPADEDLALLVALAPGSLMLVCVEDTTDPALSGHAGGCGRRWEADRHRSRQPGSAYGRLIFRSSGRQ